MKITCLIDENKKRKEIQKKYRKVSPQSVQKGNKCQQINSFCKSASIIYTGHDNILIFFADLARDNAVYAEPNSKKSAKSIIIFSRVYPYDILTVIISAR